MDLTTLLKSLLLSCILCLAPVLHGVKSVFAGERVYKLCGRQFPQGVARACLFHWTDGNYGNQRQRRSDPGLPPPPTTPDTAAATVEQSDNANTKRSFLQWLKYSKLAPHQQDMPRNTHSEWRRESVREQESREVTWAVEKRAMSMKRMAGDCCQSGCTMRDLSWFCVR